MLKAFISNHPLLSPVGPPNPNRLSLRVNFQWNVLLEAQGPVLNVGCSNDPFHFRERAMHFDLDDWSEFFDSLSTPEAPVKFIQGDAHVLDSYVDKGLYDTIILGDVVEHLYDPLKALKACARTTSRRLAFSIWQEWRLPGPGKHVETSAKLCNEDSQALGFADAEDYQVQTFPLRKGVPNKDVPHLGHIWQFTHEMVTDLVREVVNYREMDLIFGALVPEAYVGDRVAYNWLVLLERRGYE